MIKVSFYPAVDDDGQHVFPLFTKSDCVFEKVAAPNLRPDVLRYIEALRPTNDSQYVLMNAMAAGEYFGSNINGDYFTEESLMHRPDQWTGDPPVDRALSKNWPYGFPSFYNANPFAHHRNKNPEQGFGEVELASWHPDMKRVELVVRVDKDKCQRFGGVGAWDKLKAGQFPDVSMGCFRAGTLVTMADGTRKPIEQIVTGDRVLTHRGRVRAVTATHTRSYAGEFYSIKAEAHRVVGCTRQHPFYAVPETDVKCADMRANHHWMVGKKICPNWVHAECLDIDHYLLAPVASTYTALGMPQGKARAFARLLGYYLAEGHLLRNKFGELCGIELTTNKNDVVHAEISELCATFVTKNPPSSHIRDNCENAVGIYIFDGALAALCLEHAGAYSTKKRLSEAAMGWPKELQFELLGAYANGDGCGPVDGSLKFSTASNDLSWQLVQLLERKGCPASHSVLQHKATGFSIRPTTEYVVHIGKQWSAAFSLVCAKIRSSEVLKSKHSRIFALAEGTDDTFVVTPLRGITSMYVETEVYNLEVEEDESYVVEGLAVHNCKVPFDTCSICLDWKLYREAQATFDPKRHRHPGEAVLQFHKRLIASGKRGIRGLAITRVDYCEHARRMMNKILPDGRKVFVYNDYPRFFDISFVFIGADKTAKVMAKIAEQSTRAVWSLPSAELAESLGYADFADAPLEKSASIDDLLKEAFLGKSSAQKKDAEISKDIVPSQFAGQAVPILSNVEHDLPTDLIDRMSTMPIDDVLGTTTALGMILRPREFQRLVMGGMGLQREADVFADQGVVFSKQQSDEQQNRPFGYSPLLSRLLEPFLEERSAFGPFIEKRITIMIVRPQQSGTPASHNSELLRKIGTAYDGYRKTAMHYLPEVIEKFDQRGSPDALAKLSTVSIDRVITPLTFAYFQDAFLDEASCGKTAQADVSRRVEGRLPQRTRVL